MRASSTTQRVGVGDRAGEGGAVRPARGAAPGRRVCSARVQAAERVDRDRVPDPAAAGLERERPRMLDRLELPAHRAGLRVECVDRPAPERHVADRAREHEAPPRQRRDVDELLGRARQVAAPELLAGGGGERERVGVGRAVHAPVGECEPVRPVVARVVAMRPAHGSGRSVEREDVALQVLDVDRVAVGDRGRREEPREARRRSEAEAPAGLQPPDRARRDRRAGGRPRPLEIGVRERPGAARGVAAAAAAEKDRAERRGRDQGFSCRVRGHGTLVS